MSSALNVNNIKSNSTSVCCREVIVALCATPFIFHPYYSSMSWTSDTVMFPASILPCLFTHTQQRPQHLLACWRSVSRLARVFSVSSYLPSRWYFKLKFCFRLVSSPLSFPGGPGTSVFLFLFCHLTLMMTWLLGPILQRHLLFKQHLYMFFLMFYFDSLQENHVKWNWS